MGMTDMEIGNSKLCDHKIALVYLNKTERRENITQKVSTQI